MREVDVGGERRQPAAAPEADLPGERDQCECGRSVSLVELDRFSFRS
jgi:hypothetical protein